jgi:RNA polymerase sigma factor (TIGR02999 family)
MEAVSPHEVTNLLLDWRNGDEAALARLTPLVYDELRRLAGGYLRRERAGHTLQATALVHEAYLRLIGQQHLDWQSRAHFFGVAAQVMRHVLVDHARSRRAAKRGGGEAHLPLDEAGDSADERAAELIALDDALRSLARFDERKSRVVELRYFGGLTEEETAEVLGVSPATVRRESRLAEAWLCREVRRS